MGRDRGGETERVSGRMGEWARERMSEGADGMAGQFLKKRMIQVGRMTKSIKIRVNQYNPCHPCSKIALDEHQY